VGWKGGALIPGDSLSLPTANTTPGTLILRCPANSRTAFQELILPDGQLFQSLGNPGNSSTNLVVCLYALSLTQRLDFVLPLITFSENIKTTLESGEDVLITRFGKFCVREKKERRGRNPATGENIILGARRVVHFKCSPVLKDKLNGNK
jgi:integration host factor subunit alpha